MDLVSSTIVTYCKNKSLLQVPVDNDYRENNDTKSQDVFSYILVTNYPFCYFNQKSGGDPSFTMYLCTQFIQSNDAHYKRLLFAFVSFFILKVSLQIIIFVL